MTVVITASIRWSKVAIKDLGKVVVVMVMV